MHSVKRAVELAARAVLVWPWLAAGVFAVGVVVAMEIAERDYWQREQRTRGPHG